MTETPEMPEIRPRLEFPEVDPEDLRNYWRLMNGLQLPSSCAVDLQTSFKSNKTALHARWSILELMKRRKVLDAWLHDGELEDFVLQVMAKYPLDPEPPDGQRHLIPAGDIFEAIKRAAPG